MTPPEMVEVVAVALYRSVVSFPGELHPPLSDLPKRQQDKYHRHARAVLAALTEAGTVEWGNMAEGADRPFENFGPGKQAELAAKSFARVYGIPVVSRLTLPWERAE